jgi:hypothetical protein
MSKKGGFHAGVYTEEKEIGFYLLHYPITAFYDFYHVCFHEGICPSISISQ